MIRFILNILDIKNILGMQRVSPTPDPQTNFRDVFLKSSETGAYSITASRIVYQIELDYTDSDGISTTITTISDATFNISVLGDTIIKLNNGDDNYYWGIDKMDENTDYVSVSGKLDWIRTESGNADKLQYIDLRNAENLIELPIAVNLKTLYAKATTETLRDLCLELLNNSIVRGVLWIAESDTYAQDVVALARTKGWRVYYL